MVNRIYFFCSLAAQVSNLLHQQHWLVFNPSTWFQSLVNAPVFGSDGSRLSGANYVAMLYGRPTADSLSPAVVGLTTQIMPPVPFTITVNGQGGYFFFTDSPGYVQIRSSLDPWLQVRAWDARRGASYEAVKALGIGGYGESNLFQKHGGNPFGLPSPPEPLIGLQSFNLVPEPSAVLLLLVGLPLLLLRKLRFK
jgi:hypothetical protein